MGSAAWRVLTDVRFAVLLITLLAVSGLVGMLVRQFPVTAADDPARYAAELAMMHRAWDGLPMGALIVDAFDVLGLFSVFSTPWFLVLMTVLVISIITCTIDRTPRLWRGVSHVRVEQPEAFTRLPAQRLNQLKRWSRVQKKAGLQATFIPLIFRV